MLTKSHTAWQRMLTVMLCLIVAAAMLMPQANIAFADDGQSGSTYYDGTYEGSAMGYDDEDPIKVKVTITDGKIAAVEVVSHSETNSYWKLIDLDAFFGKMIETQSADVDTVSGATVSSKGIIAAVKKALEQASVDPEGFYSSGDGTAKKPYIIETADQLVKFASVVDSGEGIAADGFAGKYVALDADIDLSKIDNWNPIGTEGATAGAVKFAGTFDGQGHTVSGMKIAGSDLAAETNVGLFAALDKNAAVKNLKMTGVDIDVKGSAVVRAGSIAGDTVNGSSSADGTVIDRCSAEGSVKAESSGASLVFAGGIIGRAMKWVMISNTWTDVDTQAVSTGGSNSAYAGGLFGTGGLESLAVNCVAFGDAYACSPKSTNMGGMAGGLSAMVPGKAWNNYAMGNVKTGNGGTDKEWIGAIAGQITTSGMVKDGTNYVYPDTGALRAFAYYADDITLKIEKWSGGEVAETADTDLRAIGTDTKTNYDKVFETLDSVKAMKREDMAKQDFADTLNGNLKEVRKLLDAYGYEEVNIYNWTAEDGKVLPAGDKWVNKEPDASLFEKGEGSETDPFIIKTKDQLTAFAGSLTEGIDYDGYFVALGDDIDVSDIQWQPVGGQEYAFNGTFDGAGYTVKGMNAGTKEEPYKMTKEENPYMGFFGVLGKDAVVKDLVLTDVSIYADMVPGRFLGGIAAANESGQDTGAGTLIDGCSVSGTLEAVSSEGNTFVGGIIAYQTRGAVINCFTDTDVSCKVTKGNYIAEAGGISALTNRGLIANCCTTGDVWGSASRSDGDEGMASTGNICAVMAGDLVGCVSRGGNETAEYSHYAGELAGWITGIGKVYSSYYNKDAKMVINGQAVVPPADFGTKVAPGVNEDGDQYTGGLVNELTAYTEADIEGLADKLNAKFSEYPIDLTQYGLTGKELKKWKYDSDAKFVVFDSENAEATYKQPSCEIVEKAPEEMRNGTWAGRSEDKSAVVEIEVRSGKVVKTDVIEGEKSGEAYEEALAKAEEKALYGDSTGYGKADMSIFKRGSGTNDDPYRVTNEKQLRAIAEGIGEDETFEGVYFKQAADIDVSGEEWLPIGHVVMAEIKGKWKQYAAYAFRGCYDGAEYTISGLNIGSADAPTADPEAQTTAAMFGLIAGRHNTNEAIAEGETICELKNIVLKNEVINVSSTSQNYTGGLVGSAQNGFAVDNCRLEGSISSCSADSNARAGGLCGYALRGTVTNCAVDMDVYAASDAGNAYAGGMHAMDNRTGTLNSYALGDVTADAGANNKVHVGGFTGQFGGLHYNCYAAGDVTALKTTMDAGLVNGRFAGISAAAKVYFNKSAKLTVAGQECDPEPNGVVVDSVDPESVGIEGKSSAEIRSAAFADLLTQNEMNVVEDLNALSEKISGQTTLTHTILFSGTSEDLLAWEADGIVKLTDDPAREAIASARTEINELFEEVTVDPALEGVLEEALADAIDSIDNASDVETAEKALKEAKEKLAVLAEQSKRLSVVKSMARNELLTKKLTDYSDTRREEIIDIVVAAQEAIDKAESQDEVETILVEASAKIAAVKTDAAIAKEKAAKEAAKKAAAKTAAAKKAKTKIKVKAKKGRKAKITWKRIKNVSGYEIYRAKKKNGKYVKVGTVKGAKKAKFVSKKLKAKKKYYFKVRAYTDVNGKKIYGKWSNKKAVKAKK